MRWPMLLLVLGMITTLDPAGPTLVLDTCDGPQTLVLPPSLRIRGERGEALALADLGPGDAVSYDTSASILHVARQFWAIPGPR